MHTRQAIREAVTTALTGLTTTGSNVFTSRVYALGIAKLPCVAIFADSEEIQTVTMRLPRTQERRLNVKIEIYVRGTADYDDKLDTICAEVEAAIYADVTLGGLAKDSLFTSFDAQFAGEGDQPVAVGILTLSVKYHTIEGSPIS